MKGKIIWLCKSGKTELHEYNLPETLERSLRR